MTRPEVVPASAAQRGLWLEERLRGPSASYALPLGLRLTGPVDAAALDAAFRDVVARHEALRTLLVEGPDGLPVQHVLPPDTPTGPLPARDAVSAPHRSTTPTRSPHADPRVRPARPRASRRRRRTRAPSRAVGPPRPRASRWPVSRLRTHMARRVLGPRRPRASRRRRRTRVASRAVGPPRPRVPRRPVSRVRTWVVRRVSGTCGSRWWTRAGRARSGSRGSRRTPRRTCSISARTCPFAAP
ncbi:condensation domain-containing protein [Actinomadura sp. CNU-125]|uniref:condensation domain-containing protein n=1 Tax=Actinomadura sp. CNU-125 TaxID=1904961 RepID=UPI00096A9250